MSDRNDRCANPKCSKPHAPDREYCNEYCYRDHLQQLQDVGEFDERCNICGALPERCQCSNVGMSVRDGSVNKFQQRRKRDQERGLDRVCPRCGAKSGQPCRNLSTRSWQQSDIPATHKERHQ